MSMMLAQPPGPAASATRATYRLFQALRMIDMRTYPVFTLAEANIAPASV